MKLQFLTILLFASFSAHADVSPFERLTINDKDEFTAVRIILLDQMLTINNLRITTQNKTIWKDEELRIQALKCDVQELEEITLRLYEKNKQLITKEEYTEKVEQYKNKIKSHIPNCQEIKQQDSKVNWKTVAEFPASQ